MPTSTSDTSTSSPFGGLAAFAISGVCVHAVRPTASYRALELGGSALEVGFVAAAYGLLAMFLGVPVGRAVDRRDPRNFLLGGIGFVMAGTTLSALSPTFLLLALGQVLVGAGWMTAAISFQTITANRRNSNRDQGFAHLAVAGSIGQLVGPLIAGRLLEVQFSASAALSGSALALLVGLMFALVGWTVGWRYIESTEIRAPEERPDEESVPLRRIVRRRGVPEALLVGLAVLNTIDLLIVYLPVIGESRGIAPSVVGLLLSLRAAAGLVSRLSLPRLLERLGRRQLLMASLSGAGLALVAVSLTSAVWLLAVLLGLVGFCLGIGTPLTMAWLAVQTPRAERATVLGVRMTGNRMSQAVFPLVFGALAAAVGPAAVFLVLSVMLLGSTGMLRQSSMEGASAPDDRSGISEPPED